MFAFDIITMYNNKTSEGIIVTKEELKKLNEWIAELSVEEQKERDIYLRKLAAGEYQGPPVGYPSIDKSQLKYYDFEKYLKDKPKMTVTEEIFTNNIENLDMTAIEFFGTKISFKQLFNKIKESARAFANFGVKEGDYVTLCLTSIPEAAYSFYAMGYLGSVGIFIPPYVNPEKMISDISSNNCKVLVVMDKLYGYIKDTIKKTSIEKIIIVPTLNSSLLGVFSKKIKVENLQKEFLWNDFIKLGRKSQMPKIVAYKENLPLSVVYSSGTSGFIKGILLSHDSYQNSIQAYSEIGIDISVGQRLYQVIPAWTSTGTSTCLHLPLTYGSCVFMDPRFNPDQFAKNISRKKINYAVGTTSLYEGFEKEENIKKRKFPDFHYPFVGGTAITEKQKHHLEEIFNEHGCKNKVRTAYGRCEDGAAIATQTQKIEHQKNSVGIPLSNVIVKIVDDDLNELTYNERGHILVSSKCRMIEYYNNTELNKDYYIIDEFGEKWSPTGDIGHIGINGELYVDGREKDVSIINGSKIYNFDVKSILIEEPDIMDCEVFSKCSEKGDVLCAHIMFVDKYIKQDYNDRLIQLQNIIYDAFNDYNMIPQVFKIRDSFPMSRSTKRDIAAMKKEEDGFIFLPFEKENVMKKIK